MSNSKRARREKLDPKSLKEAKQMSAFPGGPMNNTPQNVASVPMTGMTLDGSAPLFPYQDSGLAQNDMRAYTPIPNENSGMPQSMAIGRLYNNNPYGLQPNPTPEQAAGMPGSYLGKQAEDRGLYATMLGPTGMPVQPGPGGSTPQNQQTAQALPLQGMQSAEVQPKGMNTRSGKRSKA